VRRSGQDHPAHGLFGGSGRAAIEPLVEVQVERFLLFQPDVL
jgi:hypothetical protein